MQLEDAEPTPGKHALLLSAVLLAQLVSNLLLPGLGIAFLGLLIIPGWFGRRADRIVLGIGAILSATYLAVALVDGVAGPTIGHEFG